jgi:hypothetical protein
MRTLRIAGIALFLGLASSAPALAQGRTLGVRLGASIATLNTDAQDLLDRENRTGIVAGVFYNRSLGGPLGYQVEVLYASRGTDFEDGSSFDLAYVEIPALLKVSVPVGMVRPGVFGGVALALKVDCKIDDGTSESCDDVEGLDVKSTDFNAVVGGDLQLGLAGLSVWGDARYYVGLSDVGELGDVVEDVKNRSWELTAGVGIPLP